MTKNKENFYLFNTYLYFQKYKKGDSTSLSYLSSIVNFKNNVNLKKKRYEVTPTTLHTYEEDKDKNRFSSPITRHIPIPAFDA